MNKRESAKPGSGRLRRHNQLRALHRWFGLASLLFVLVLSLTGIGLNHSVDLGLDRRFLDSDWLLDWYGFDAPAPTASFAIDDHRITLVGNRLYLDGREAARGISDIVGAVSRGGLFLVATDESLLYLSSEPALVDRVELGTQLPAAIEGLTVAGEGVLIKSRERVFGYDETRLELRALAASPGELSWSSPSAAPDAVLAEIYGQYRGPGVSIERLLYDLHSGRLFARAGTAVMDAAGLLLVLLSVTGLVLWVKRRS